MKYFETEEEVEFKDVHLKPDKTLANRKPSQGGGAGMVNWFVDSKEQLQSKTRLGLAVNLSNKIEGFGYSGPGYSDMAWLKFSVDTATLVNGVSGSNVQVDQVDAWRDSNPRTAIYDEINEKGRLVNLLNQEVAPVVTIQLHIARHIVKKRLPFTLILPIQQGKDIFELSKPNPNPSQVVKWPAGFEGR